MTYNFRSSPRLKRLDIIWLISSFYSLQISLIISTLIKLRLNPAGSRKPFYFWLTVRFSVFFYENSGLGFIYMRGLLTYL